MSKAYEMLLSVREGAATLPGEIEVQALWFEQLYQPVLATDDGRTVSIVQPGFWNHGSGPDFTRAVVRFGRDGAPEGEISVGNVEVHLRPADWNAHGHHTDPAYEDTVLHVVWETGGGKTFFPATASFRRVPQVVIGKQLVAPWPELRPLCASLLRHPLPGATPGRCSPALAQLPAAQLTGLLREAGFFRMQQKAQRWRWRRHLAGPEQVALGNKVGPLFAQVVAT